MTNLRLNALGKSGISLKPHLWLIHLIGIIVPRRLRADWRQEWEAELHFREMLLSEWDNLNWQTKLDLLRRSLGAFWDALLLQPYRLEDEMFQDVRYGLRMLLKKPSFTVIAVLTLALGIGACTAIFSVVDAVLLRPLPYPQAENLLSLREVDAQGRQITFAARNFQDVAERNQTLVATAQYNTQITTVLGGSEPVRTSVTFVSRDFFKVLGTQPAVGRSFLPEENQIGGNPVAVVSAGFWKKLLNRQSDLSATSLRIDNTNYTVVGVMPDEFNFPKDAEIWLPAEVEPFNSSRTSHGWRVIGRLNEGISLAQARLDLSTIGKQLRQENDGKIDLVDLAAMPLQEALVGSSSSTLLVMLAAVGVLMLIACANVANLLLAQITTRQHEFDVRAALGATRWRLARQFITESLMLAALAGSFGVLLSFWGVQALLSLNQDNLPRAEEIGINTRALVFTLALSTLAAVGLGLVPLLRFGGSDLHAGLKEAGRGKTANAASHRLRSLLVVTQVALTLVLLVGAGLLGKSFLKLLSIDPGFRTDNAVAMEISVPVQGGANDAQTRAYFYQQLLERVSSLPGVTAAGGINGLPMTGGAPNGQFLIDNNPDLKGYGELRIATPGYFKAMGIQLLRGRLLADSDGSDTQHVALISESLARQYWPNEEPLGKHLQYGNMDGDRRLLQIVGVVSDVREFGLDANPRPTVYAHYLQRPRQAWNFTIVSRTTGDPSALIPAMQSTLQSLNRDVPMKFRTLAQIFSSSLDNRRFSLVLFGVFAVVALLLAALGIYGVTSYAVTQRTPELGLRLALGAQGRDVLRLVIGQGMKAVLAGCVIGLAGAVAVMRLIAHLLFEMSATDPLTFATIVVVLLLVALTACWIPARRAMKVDPMVALRHE
ncbi:MAG: ABC transporter permease [Acidobacteriota bacterium]